MKKNSYFYLLLLCLLSLSVSISAQPKKVACIGNSITEGWGLSVQSQAYPFVLQSFIGDDFVVNNYGVSAHSVLHNSDIPYWNTSQYQAALEWEPDIVIIKLGTNDAKPVNWDNYKDEFKGDYIEFIESFKDLASQPQIYMCYPVPIFPNSNHAGSKGDAVIKEEMIPIMDEIATETGASVIDLHTPFEGENFFFDDGLHPNASGARKMASLIAKAIKPDVVIDQEYLFSNVTSFDCTAKSESLECSVAGVDLTALFDKNASTSATLPYEKDMAITINCSAPIKATGYSITCSDPEKAIKGWRLEGYSRSKWNKLDEKANITFLTNETKIYPSIASPSVCTAYRLVIRDTNGNEEVCISEVQLFGSLSPLETSITSNGGTITDEHDITGNEGVAKLIDSNTGSKYCAVDFGPTYTFEYVSPVAVRIDRYALVSANDASERDPLAWTLEASVDGNDWVSLDSQFSQQFISRFSTMEYALDNDNAKREYTHFRLTATGNVRGNIFQFSEWQLFEYNATSLRPINDMKCNVTAESGVIHIESGSDEIVKYEIYTTSGSLFATGDILPGNQKTELCSAGIYLVSLSSSTGKKTIKVRV